MTGFNDLLFGQERGNIARASASTYIPQELARLGLEITLNINNQKVRYVGNPPVYPEIIVWRPDYSGSTNGQAVVVEMVETEGSLAYPRINEWLILGLISGLKFNLIIPSTQLTRVRELLQNNNVDNVKIQTWQYDFLTSRYTFNQNPQ